MNNLVFGPSGAISFVDGQDTNSPSTNNDDQLPQQAPFAIAHNAEQPAIASDTPLSALFTPDAEATQTSQASPTASDIQTAEATPSPSTGSSASSSDSPSSSPSSTSQSTTPTSITQVGSIASSTSPSSTASSTASSSTLTSLSNTSSAASSSATLSSLSTTAAHISATPSAVLSSTQSQHGPPFYIGLSLLGIAAVAIVAALIAWLVRMRSVSRRRRYAASINIPWADDADNHSFSNDKTNGYAFNHATSTFIHSSEKASPPELAHLPSAMDSRDHLGARQLQITNMNPGDNHSVPSSGVPSPHPNEDMGTPRAQFAPRYLAVGDGGLDVPWAAPQMRPTLSARLRGRWKAQDEHPGSAPQFDRQPAFDRQSAFDRQPEQPPTIPAPDTTDGGWTSTLRQSVVNAFTYALPATLVAGPTAGGQADNLTAGGPPSRASTRRSSVRRTARDLERGPSEGYVGGELVGLPYHEPNTRGEPALSRRSTASTYIPTLDAYMGFDHAFSPNPMGKRFEGGREGTFVDAGPRGHGDANARGFLDGRQDPFEAPRMPRKSSTELTMPEGMMAMGSSGMGALQMPRPAAVADTRVAPVSRMGSVAVPSRRDSLIPTRKDTLAAPSRRDTLCIPSRVSSTASRMSKLSGPEEFARQRLVERAQRRRVSGCVEVEEEGLQ
ncbi:hypothetical protein K525DRAFT_206324 [Schizophyllum commune Loenen D]|nr:hypothetical protein K525DRAFT_206324 [Schizophyllum commune Loenen D]